MPGEYQGAGTKAFRKLYGYRNLIAWQKADDLAANVHEVTATWGPGYYRLSDQMRSAAVSAKSNIAEGYCRAALGDYIRFCEIARGSLGELGSQIQDCERWGLVGGDTLADLLEQYGEATLLLERLIAGLKKKQQSGGWDRSFGVQESAVAYLPEDVDLLSSFSSAEGIIELEQRYVLQTYKRAPFVLERGEGVYLYDTEGRRYLDLVAGIAVNALGYGDPEVLGALAAQAQALIHGSNLYHSIPQALLARDLVERSFADRVFFCNSGTEANEAAFKFARKWQRTNHPGEERSGILAFSGSFHGRTMGALSATHRDKYRLPFEPLVPGFSFAPYNDIAAARAAIGPSTGAVIVEPLQGEGGVYPAEPAFLRALRQACDEQGALLIFDEVQCGLGRAGTLWAHEAAGVTPDIMTLAKPLGGGFPIGAVLLTERVAGAIAAGDHGSTFAASPAICAVARIVLRRVGDPGFLAAVQRKGDLLQRRLEALRARHPAVREVRGRGLIWGLELAVEAAPLINAGYERGLIVASAGERVLRLVPPLVIGEEQIDEAVAILDQLLAQIT